MLLLRAAVGLAATAEGVLYLYAPSSPILGKWSLGVALMTSGVALVIGFLTPLGGFSVGLCFLGMAISWFPVPAGLHDARLVALGMLVMAAAIALLGPGAYSLDGHLFGRREIVIPPSSPPPQS